MYKQKKTIKPYEVGVSEFKGLSKLPVRQDNELSSCINMVFDKYPVMSTRGKRYGWLDVGDTAQAVIQVGNSSIYYISDGQFYYNGQLIPNSGFTAGSKSMVLFWNKIYIFPDGKCYDLFTNTITDIGVGTYPNDIASCPAIDYAVVHNNRIWGVKDNHIYASSLGRAIGDKSWNYFIDSDGNPAESGSFAIDCSIDGKIKGITSWDNRIVLLGEQNHLEIYGEYPSNFSLRNITKNGTVNHKSIAEVDSKLFYVSTRGVLQYSGGTEVNISRNLNETYDDAIACSDGIRYYLSLNNRLYVYNSAIGSWTEESTVHQNSPIVEMYSVGGYVYAVCQNGVNKRLSENESLIDTESVVWSFEFDDYSPRIYSNTIIRNLKLKVKGESGAYMKIEVSTDSNEWEVKKEVTFPNNALQSVNIGLDRGMEHRFRVSGKGYIEVYGYQYSFVDGGDKA